MKTSWFLNATLMLSMSVASFAYAQPAPERRLTVDAAIGFDNSISGNINSSGVGQLNGQQVLITKNRYEDVYGTGLHLRFGMGYFVDAITELRGTITIQSLDGELTPMGEYGPSRLYGKYEDYQSVGLDFALRRYVDMQRGIRAYGEATIGIAVVDETDVALFAPGSGLANYLTDFYDRTAAFTFGGNAGLSMNLSPNVSAFAQVGLRRVGGMTKVDSLVGTGLEQINARSVRWTLPFVTGVSLRF